MNAITATARTSLAIHIVRATHPIVPGCPTSLHVDRADADRAALALVETIKRDCITRGSGVERDFNELCARSPLPDPITWEALLVRVQVARLAWDAGDSVLDVLASANEQGDPSAYLANASGADVWIETLDAELPAPAPAPAPELHHETATTLILSTAHLSEATCNGALHNRSGAYEKGDWGWFVHVGDAGTYEDDPIELVAARGYARSVGCEWIMFDRDADTIDALPTYGWEDGDCVHNWRENAEGFNVCTKCDVEQNHAD